MTNRERLKAVLNFQRADRLPIIEWAGWWSKTIERWYDEGLPRSLEKREEIALHFGLDPVIRGSVNGLSHLTPRPSIHGLPIIQNAEQYEQIKSTLYIMPQSRDFEELAKKQIENDYILLISVDGFFWFPRNLFGIENHLYAFYDHAELMHRINADLSEYIIKSFQSIFKICKPDIVYIQEDLSYNLGPMLSKEQFEEFLKPYYQKIIPVLKESGAIIFVDSDGKVDEIVDWFEQAGIEGIWPLERQAGVDVAELRKKYPRMRFLGGFDKTVMHKGENALRAEFERLLPVAQQGGYIISCDHQTPPEVSYNDYKLYIRLFHEYAVSFNNGAS